jgi:hypothetical protein
VVNKLIEFFLRIYFNHRAAKCAAKIIVNPLTIHLFVIFVTKKFSSDALLAFKIQDSDQPHRTVLNHPVRNPLCV